MSENIVRAPSLTDLQALAERLEGMSGADREVDALIACAFADLPDFDPIVFVGPMTYRPSTTRAGEPIAEAFSREQRVGMRKPHLYSSSLDAAVVLVERVLPEANCWGVERTPNDITGYVSRNNVAAGHWLYERTASTAPLALLRALVAAKIEEAKAEQGGGT